MGKKNSVREVLIVDGNNMIGVWTAMKYWEVLDHNDARVRLIGLMADYQGYSGYEILLVFDAYRVAGKGSIEVHNKLKVLYSAHEQTADQYIESLVHDLIARGRKVSVATADHLEQTITFAKGALRVAARELWQRVEQSRTAGREHFSGAHKQVGRHPLDERLGADTLAKLEQMRREKK
jgi:predicted RNA-binding protein with PIN domain